MNIWMFIAIGIAVFVLYTLYTMLMNVSLVKGVVKVNEWRSIDKKEFDEMGDKIFYDGWLFISNAATGRTTQQVILKREFAICMDGTSFGVYKRTGAASQTEVATATENFPLNKWVYFAVRYADKTLEIYLNGKLVKTVYFASETDLIDTAYKKNQNLDMGGSASGSNNSRIAGYITKLRRLTDPPDANYIWQHYLEGNGQLSGFLGNLFRDRYGMKVSVYNESKQKTRELSIL
jgi:hypothetical protein